MEVNLLIKMQPIPIMIALTVMRDDFYQQRCTSRAPHSVEGWQRKAFG